MSEQDIFNHFLVTGVLGPLDLRVYRRKEDLDRLLGPPDGPGDDFGDWLTLYYPALHAYLYRHIAAGLAVDFAHSDQFELSSKLTIPWYSWVRDMTVTDFKVYIHEQGLHARRVIIDIPYDPDRDGLSELIAISPAHTLVHFDRQGMMEKIQYQLEPQGQYRYEKF